MTTELAADRCLPEGRSATRPENQTGDLTSSWDAATDSLTDLPFPTSVVNTDESGGSCLDSSAGATEHTNRNSPTAYGRFHRRAKLRPAILCRACRLLSWGSPAELAQDTPSSALYARCATAGGVRHLRALAIGRMDTIISYSGPGRRVSARPLLDSVPGSVYRCTRWRDGIRAACGFAQPSPHVATPDSRA